MESFIKIIDLVLSFLVLNGKLLGNEVGLSYAEKKGIFIKNKIIINFIIIRNLKINKTIVILYSILMI